MAPKKIRQYIFDNLFIKMISLFFAIMLWFYVSSKGVVEMNFTVPIELKNLPESFVIASNVIEYVDVRLKGRENILNRLKRNEINLSIDLSNVKTGNNQYLLKPDNINIPPSIEVTWINPKKINIKIESIPQSLK